MATTHETSFLFTYFNIFILSKGKKTTQNQSSDYFEKKQNF